MRPLCLLLLLAAGPAASAQAAEAASVLGRYGARPGAGPVAGLWELPAGEEVVALWMGTFDQIRALSSGLDEAAGVDPTGAASEYSGPRPAGAASVRRGLVRAATAAAAARATLEPATIFSVLLAPPAERERLSDSLGDPADTLHRVLVRAADGAGAAAVCLDAPAEACPATDPATWLRLRDEIAAAAASLERALEAEFGAER